MMEQTEVNYRKGDEEVSCSSCEYFKEDSCEKVSGVIAPQGLCDLFTLAKGRTSGSQESGISSLLFGAEQL